MGGDWMGCAMGWNWLFLVLLVVGIAVLVAALVRLLSGGRGPEDDGRRARQILDERYARGDIDTGEYQERLRQLRGQK